MAPLGKTLALQHVGLLLGQDENYELIQNFPSARKEYPGSDQYILLDNPTINQIGYGSHVLT